MQATSSDQYDSTVKATVPDLERVRDNVWAMPMPMPYGSVPYSLTYFVRDETGGVHVIDPGYNSIDNWGVLAFSLQRIGRSMTDVASIVVTHLHSDHAGLAERLRKSSGGRIVMHRAEQAALHNLAQTDHSKIECDAWGVPAERRKELDDVSLASAAYPAFTADELVEDGDVIEVPGRDLSVIHTPGHTTGSMCLRLAEESIIFSGDHVLPAVYPGLGLGGDNGGNPIADYFASLERIALYDDHEVLPGHGYRFTGLAQRAERTAAHHHRRSAEVSRVLLNNPNASVWETAGQLTWTAGWENLRGFYMQSALSQTAMHMDYARSTAVSL